MHLKGLTQRSGCFNNPQWVPQPIPQSTMKVSHNEEAATMGAQYRDTNEHFFSIAVRKTFLLKRRFLGSWGVERRFSGRGHRCSWSAWSGVISLYGIICHIYAYMPDISKYVTNIIFGAWSGDTFMSQISYWANIWR